MEFHSICVDELKESQEIWGKDWRYIVYGKNCRLLKQPFDMRKIPDLTRRYGRGGPYVYVAQEDERYLMEQGMLD